MSYDLDKFKESVYAELQSIRRFEANLDGSAFEKRKPAKPFLLWLFLPILEWTGKKVSARLLDHPDYALPHQTANELIADPVFKQNLCKPFRKTFYSELTDMRLVEIVVYAITGFRTSDGKTLNARDYAFICYELSKHGHENYCRDDGGNLNL